MNGSKTLGQGYAGTVRLKVGENADGAPFEVPAEIATEASVFFGRRGTGKTYTASVLVEELLERGQQVVVIDPLDVWWGLRSSADGRDEGFPIAVLGGTNGDLPLEEADAYDLADFVVEQRASLILSLRHLRPRDRDRFVARFCDQLYHRKGEAEHRTPLLVVFDEARLFAPQKVSRKGQADVLEAVEAVVRLGRASGLGAMLVDQRPASVSKDVISQIETLVCHRLLAPHDRRAVDEWISQHDTEGRREEFLTVLSSLPKGMAWFWSPALDVFDLVSVRKRKTFDSSRTPELGENPAASLPAKPADASRGSAVEALRGLLLTAQANRTEEDEDPDALRRRIRELKSALAKAPAHPGGAKPGAETARLERKIREAEAEKKEAVEAATAPLKERLSFYETTLAEARDRFGSGMAILARADDPAGSGGHPGSSSGTAPGPGPEASGRRSEPEENQDGGSTVGDANTNGAEPGTHSGGEGASADGEGGEQTRSRSTQPQTPYRYRDERLAAVAGDLSEMQASILANLRAWDEAGVPALARDNVAVLAGRSPKYSRFHNRHLRHLFDEGLIEPVASEGGGDGAAPPLLGITGNGLAVAGLRPVEPEFAPTLEGLRDAWFARLDEPSRALCAALVRRHPGAFSRDELAREIVSSPRSGAFGRKLAEARSWGLVEDTESGKLRASNLWFPGAQARTGDGAAARAGEAAE